MMQKEITMITRNVRMRSTDDIGIENDVCNFKFLRDVHYPSVSFEALFLNREEGFYELIQNIISLSDTEQSQYIMICYSELDTLIPNTKLNRYKGFWKLQSSNENGFDWLKNKHDFLSEIDGKIKLSGYALASDYDLKKIISCFSYKKMSFYTYLNKKNFDEKILSNIISLGDYKDVIMYFLKCEGLVFFLLGDEDYKSSEVVVISNNSSLKEIRQKAKILCC